MPWLQLFTLVVFVSLSYSLPDNAQGYYQAKKGEEFLKQVARELKITKLP